jgi:hypothetical protein
LRRHISFVGPNRLCALGRSYLLPHLRRHISFARHCSNAYIATFTRPAVRVLSCLSYTCASHPRTELGSIINARVLVSDTCACALRMLCVLNAAIYHAKKRCICVIHVEHSNSTTHVEHSNSQHKNTVRCRRIWLVVRAAQFNMIQFRYSAGRGPRVTSDGHDLIGWRCCRASNCRMHRSDSFL